MVKTTRNKETHVVKKVEYSKNKTDVRKEIVKTITPRNHYLDKI